MASNMPSILAIKIQVCTLINSIIKSDENKRLTCNSKISTKMRHLFQIPLTTHPCSDVSSHCAQRTATNSCTIEVLTRASSKKLAEFRQRGDGGGDEKRERVVELFDAFLDYLPTNGAVVLTQDILVLKDDDGSVFQLHDHLVDGIVIPCKYMHLCWVKWILRGTLKAAFCFG